MEELRNRLAQGREKGKNTESHSARAGARWTVTGTMTYRDPQSFARILYEAGILKTESMFEGEGNLAAAAK